MTPEQRAAREELKRRGVTPPPLPTQASSAAPAGGGGGNDMRAAAIAELKRRGVQVPQAQPNQIGGPAGQSSGAFDISPIERGQPAGVFERQLQERGYSLQGQRGDAVFFTDPNGQELSLPMPDLRGGDDMFPADDPRAAAFDSLAAQLQNQYEAGKPAKPMTYMDKLRENTRPESMLDTATAMVSGVNNLIYQGADDDIANAVGLTGYEQTQDRLREEKPYAFQGGQVIAGSVPFGAVMKAANPQTIKGAMVTAGGFGMMQGGALGYGDADGEGQNRVKAGLEGGAVGGAFGAALGGGIQAAPAIKEGAKSALNAVTPAELKALGSMFTNNPRSAAQIRNDRAGIGNSMRGIMQGDDPSPQALSVLNRLFRKSGMSDDDIRGVAESVAQDRGNASSLAAGRRTIGERYAAALEKPFPQAHENLMLTLQEGGLLSGGRNQSARITREAGQEAAESQAPFLEGRTRQAFGADSQLEQEDMIAHELRRIGDEGFNAVLSRGFTDDAQAQILQRRLSGPVGEQLRRAVRADAAREGLDIDQYIERNPAQAAHWMQSFAGRKAADLSGTAEGVQWSKMREQLVDPLRRGVDGYADAQAMYADEAQAMQAVGMGKRFFTLAKDETGLDRFKRALHDLPQSARPVALTSVRNTIIEKLRAGQEGGSVQFGQLGSRGFLNGLETVFGREGKALADDIRALKSERDFFNRIDPRASSRTVPNMEAMRTGSQLRNNGLANALSENGGAAGLDVGFSLATGNPTAAFSALKLGKGVVRGRAEVKPQTMNDFSRLMMNRPSGALDAPVPARQLPSPQRTAYAPDGNRALNEPQGQQVRLSDLYDKDDPMNPMGRSRLAGGVDDAGRYQSPDDIAANEARQVVQEANSAPQRPNRFNTSQNPRVPDWEGPLPERPTPLTEWVKRMGGVNDAGGDVEAILGGKNTRIGVISNMKRGGRESVSGRQIDYMTEAAIDDGYLPRGATQQDFLDALADDARGSNVFPQHGTADASNAAFEWQAYTEWATRARVDTPYEAAAKSRDKGKRGSLLDPPAQASALPALMVGGGIAGAAANEQNALAVPPASQLGGGGSRLNALAYMQGSQLTPQTNINALAGIR